MRKKVAVSAFTAVETISDAEDKVLGLKERTCESILMADSCLKKNSSTLFKICQGNSRRLPSGLLSPLPGTLGADEFQR